MLNTSDPARPRIIGQIVDPAINVVHQSDPIRLTRADGTARDVLIITDERAGAVGSAGGLHVYDVTGPHQRDPARRVTGWRRVCTPPPRDGGR